MENNLQNISIEQKALSILEKYEGSNNFILKIKKQCETNKKHIPTRSQCEYVINYSNTKPKVAKKWVDIDSYFSKKLIFGVVYVIPSFNF